MAVPNPLILTRFNAAYMHDMRHLTTSEKKMARLIRIGDHYLSECKKKPQLTLGPFTSLEAANRCLALLSEQPYFLMGAVDVNRRTVTFHFDPRCLLNIATEVLNG